MKHVDMRKLPAAAQEERRRQVIGLRQAGMTYDEIAAQVGLSATGALNISLMFVVNAFRHDGATSAGRAKGRGGWLLRSAGGRAAETTVNRL